MKKKVSIFSIVSFLLSVIALILYVMLLNGTNVFIIWIIFSVLASLFPLLSKFIRNKKGKKGKGIEITALIIGGLALYFVFFAATKINIYFVFGINIIIFILYAKLFNNVQVESKNQKAQDEFVFDKKQNNDDINPYEALDDILKIHVQNTAKALETNGKVQPDNEDDSDFGLVPEKPIFTLALMSIDGEKEYLDQLYTTNGEKIKYNRRGSISIEGINGIIDIYETFLPSGEPYKTIYINMYGASKSTKAPDGFVLNNATVTPKPIPKKKKTSKIKYCIHCGSMIDNETKKCTGCGKQYLKWFNNKINRLSVTVVLMALIIVTVLTFCVFQFINTQKLKDKNSSLEGQIIKKQSTISQLENEIDDLENEINDLETEIDDLESDLRSHKTLSRFVNDYVVFVEDDGTYYYHKFECYKFKGNYFWAYNTEKAVQLGYSPCPYCN